MAQKKVRVALISKEAFLWLYNRQRVLYDLYPLQPEEQERLWKRAAKYAPAATEDSICIDWNKKDVERLQKAGFTVKTKYINR